MLAGAGLNVGKATFSVLSLGLNAMEIGAGLSILIAQGRMYAVAERDLSELDTLTDSNYGVHLVYSA